MNLRNNVPSERSQTQKYKLYIQFHLYEILEYAKLSYGGRDQTRGYFWGEESTGKWHKGAFGGDGSIVCPG